MPLDAEKITAIQMMTGSQYFAKERAWDTRKENKTPPPKAIVNRWVLWNDAAAKALLPWQRSA